MSDDISRDDILLGGGGVSDAGTMTEAMYYVLLALTSPDHGYGLMQRIRDITGGRVAMGPGTLYGIITRLRKDGLITLEEQDERRKTYLITQKGRKALIDEYRRLKRLVEDGKELEHEI